MILENKTSNTTNDAKTIEPGDGRVFLSSKSLIALRYKAQNISLKLRKVKATQTGQYYSPFKGRGMEFDEVRLYQPGDDVRNMDWRVTARTGTPHTKLFREERERSVIVWTDLQRSMFFATRGVFKSVLAAKAAAYIAWSTLTHGDRLGYLLFNENQHLEQRPQRGKWAVLHFLQCLADATQATISTNQNDGSQTMGKDALQQALVRLRRVARPGSKIILISDFRGIDPGFASHLANLSRHNDMVLLFVYDQMEAHLPPSGLYRFNDGQRSVMVDTGSKKYCADYANRFSQHAAYLEKICTRYGVHFIPCETNCDLFEVINRGI